jgi:hypothetical protein
MIPKYMKTNYETVLAAAENGHLALLESHRVSDGERVFLLCGVSPPTEEDETYSITPFAEMIDGNPFELYEPPFSEDGDTPEIGNGSSCRKVDDKELD